MLIEVLQRNGMKAAYQTIVVAFGLILLAWIGCFSYGVPTPICPMPIVTKLPAMFLASPPPSHPYWFAALVPAFLFCAWNPNLFRRQCRIPRRSWMLLIILTALSVDYFMGSWRYGSHYQGREYTIA